MIQLGTNKCSGIVASFADSADAREPRREKETAMVQVTKVTAPTVYPCLLYNDAPAAIDWLCRAFGFESLLTVPGDEERSIIHAELKLGNGVLMLGSATKGQEVKPTDGLSSGFSLCAYVEDPDAHHARAVAAGAEVVRPLADTTYGSRGYTARDLEGNVWSFGTYLPAL
jgi:uncharacterized glyoxalase superfamily protein PhnB